jgi:hypothetical protein
MYDPGKIKNKDEKIVPLKQALKDLIKNPMYKTIVAGMIMNTWGLGGLAGKFQNQLHSSKHLLAFLLTT